ncbi:MAG TPA: endonuclease/exonuclease/phosphatase family protein [Acidimicrobiales bacterium]|nr:endonuclease/exonuclease/phosphatase family protein [Acidimicrobiales bacterium]
MRRVRVVSFNILHGRRSDGSGVVDVSLLRHSAAELRPDVLALQEVDVGVPRSGRLDQAAAVAEATGTEVVFGKAARVGGIGKYGNALLARGRMRDVEVARLPRAHRRNEPRAVILATVDLGEGTPAVSVAATHLSIHRPEVHGQLRAVVELLTNRPGPRLLVGDLNLLSEEVAPVVEEAGMVLADGSSPTFPNDDPRVRIDHVAVSSELSVAAVEVVATASSDHRALVVEVDVP